MVHTPRTAPPPPELVKHSKTWTERFQTTKGEWATRDSKRVLSTALRLMAHGKCAYCESALGVSADLEIDHYVAKTIAPHLAFEWTNLLPGCRLCNRPKSNHDHQCSVLKPDIEDPEPFFWIHPDTGKLEPHPTLDAAQKHRANETIRLCDLQRAPLCTKRVEMLERAGRWLQRLADNGLTDAVSGDWERLSHPGTEYKFVLRHVLELRGQPRLAEYDRAMFRRL